MRKLALVTLTGYMERYCPTHRSGWNWELPKFIKKIKTPDYKGKHLEDSRSNIFYLEIFRMRFNVNRFLCRQKSIRSSIGAIPTAEWTNDANRCSNCIQMAETKCFGSSKCQFVLLNILQIVSR